MASVWGELKRRNVVKVAVTYAIVGWLLVEIASTVLPTFQAPQWVLQTITFVVILGFPLALILSWAYDLTPRGVVRADSVPLSESVTRVTGRKLDFAIIGLLLVALGYVAIDQYVLEDGGQVSGSSADQETAAALLATEDETESPAQDRRSIAVIPFANRSTLIEDQFFVDGIHDDILTQLARIASLKVISRTSVMTYRDTEKNLRTIGEELDVATILEGGVQRAGDIVRINVQLIDAETDEHLWADSYDRELTAQNIFAIQSEIATSIAEALEATLSPQEVARLNELPTQNTRAYDFYLSGTDFYGRSDEYTFKPFAVQMYEQAVDEDPQFALAWARLSIANSVVYWYSLDRTESRRDRALEAVQRALELQPELPEAHLAMGVYYYRAFRDYDEALRELAIAEPDMAGDSEFFQTRAFVHRRLGNWAQVLADEERAIELDPRNVYILTEHARTHLYRRDYALAEQFVDRVLEIAPDDLFAHVLRARIPLNRDGDLRPFMSLDDPPVDFGEEGQWLEWIAAIYDRDYDEALRSLDSWEAEVYEEPRAYVPKASLQGITHQLATRRQAAEPYFQTARTIIEQALQTNIDDPRLYIALGETLAGLGEQQAAIRAAHQALELLPRSTDALWGADNQLAAVVRVFIPAGDFDAAIEELDTYLSTPGRWSIEGFLPDPRLDPIRDDPRFQALVDKYSR